MLPALVTQARADATVQYRGSLGQPFAKPRVTQGSDAEEAAELVNLGDVDPNRIQQQSAPEVGVGSAFSGPDQGLDFHSQETSSRETSEFSDKRGLPGLLIREPEKEPDAAGPARAVRIIQVGTRRETFDVPVFKAVDADSAN
jgi:hypothetical protein